MQHIEELGEAEAAIAMSAIREELGRRGKIGVIAVSDSRGELISLLRMDGCPIPSVLVATKKVWTAARERSPTGELAKAYQANGFQMANSDDFYTGWDGGVPVLRAGKVVGAVAVSGLSQEEDAEVARIGVSKIVASFGD